jgi:hypothetical protein
MSTGRTFASDGRRRAGRAQCDTFVRARAACAVATITKSYLHRFELGGKNSA